MLIKCAMCCNQSSSFKYAYTQLAISKHIKIALSIRVSWRKREEGGEDVVEVEEECKKNAEE